MEGKAEEREKVNREATEEECKSGKGESLRDKRKGWLWFPNALVVKFPPV